MRESRQRRGRRALRCCIAAGLAVVLAAACGGKSRGPDRGGSTPEDGAAEDAANAFDPDRPTGSNGAGGTGNGTDDRDGDDVAPGPVGPSGAGTTGFIMPTPAPAPPAPEPLPPRPPLGHRPIAATCDRERVPGGNRPVPGDFVACTSNEDCPVVLDCSECRSACADFGAGLQCVRGYGECVLDSDCTVGENPRCSPGGYCSADKCFDDSECSFGGPCVCEGAELGLGNTCASGNCRTDSDCGASGFCSLSVSCSVSGASGYYCHTLADTCIDDGDCSDGLQSGSCEYNPVAQHWACNYETCPIP